MSTTYKTQVFMIKSRDEPAVVYYTDRPGVRMVNAKTGYLMDGVFGSKDEDQFYTVQYATGKQIPYHTPLKLTFTDPYEYGELFNERLSKKTLDAWEGKFTQQRL